VAEVVLDASALLALIYREAGCEQVKAQVAKSAATSTANLSEVAAKLHDKGWQKFETENVLRSFNLDQISVNYEIAMLAAALRLTTREYGLGLGDRLCLATGSFLRLPVLTADRIWSEIDSPDIDIKLIR